MPRDEARRLALSHFLLSFLLYLGIAFVAPRNLIQYDIWLAGGPHMAINTAMETMGRLRAWPVLIPALAVLAYLDFRVCLWLGSAGREPLLTLWSLAVPAGIGATGLWFTWALTQWSVGLWEHHNPGAESRFSREMPYVAGAALAALATCVLVELALTRRNRQHGKTSHAGAN